MQRGAFYRNLFFSIGIFLIHNSAFPIVIFFLFHIFHEVASLSMELLDSFFFLSLSHFYASFSVFHLSVLLFYTHSPNIFLRENIRDHSISLAFIKQTNAINR